MNTNITFDNQMNLINTIVKSTSDLTIILKKNTTLSDTIYNTISEIFKFMRKVLNLLPDILITGQRQETNKKELMFYFSIVQQNWDIYEDDPEAFHESWEVFKTKWVEFLSIIESIKGSRNTIFLSMN
ncbi:MAG: hypothetical protein ACM3U1_02800 [Chloroflexota bacterium]